MTAVDPVALAKLLFPEDFHDGIDCRDEVGREGLPCSICADRAQHWNERVQRVDGALRTLAPKGNQN